MCGIVSFTGKRDAVSVLMGGLARLEYRGYDSAGISLIQDGELATLRRKGKVAELQGAIDESKPQGTTGIGHTRWATHGVPSEENAHPHRDCSGKIAVVHNGIIENHAQLHEKLEQTGHRFTSRTDTEVVAHLIEQEFEAAAQNDTAQTDTSQTNTSQTDTALLAEAVRRAITQLSGSFALAVIHADYPDTIIVSRNDSPLALGSCADGAIAASDIPALIEHTRDVIYLNDRDLAILHSNGDIECFDPAGIAYVPQQIHVEWTLEAAERGGHPDFMHKEIHEQPRVIRDTIAGRFDEKTKSILFEELPASAVDLREIERVCIVACGTSYHAGLIGKYHMEAWGRIPVDVEVASEFRYRDPIVTSKTLVIAISQSGETADTLEAVKLARRAGAYVLAITNTLGSRITLEANTVLYIKAELEISVAATKSFLAQVALLTLFALYLGQQRKTISAEFIAEAYNQMSEVPQAIEQVLADTSAIERCAAECVGAHTALFIGRGVGATTCYEGALKLKEISYLHAEAYSAGEIKHGPIALIEPAGLEDPSLQTPVISLALQSATYDKMVANIEEVLARGAKVIALATEGDERIAELTEHVMYVPAVAEHVSPLVASVPLQLFARFIALARGCDVDQPRNLAKSVTVE
ncbi:MAG: glutamine--fructose-6-phosphate transaminase (isomerizing) [Coriobacteriales bacterium]|jgi:glucosamine--fructose-6-phosphate aminotransferase (isomerizing)|nr:glutamine--fructose-6-phosphate transaminase (isomerizing) [Coriobacteriales bacterium]